MVLDFETYGNELFNPLVYDLLKVDKRFSVSMGGAGSSKSYSQTQVEIIKLLQGKEKLLVVRKINKTLKDSCINLFLTILTNWGLQDYYTYNISDQHLKFINGSEILFKGLDDPEKIKSIAGITRIWCEEASELTYSDFKQLNIRLRGRDNLRFSITFNPIDEDHWLKKHFYDTPIVTERSCIFHTTYLDNKFIDNEYKRELESYKDIDENYYNIYALGKWGSIVEGRIFKEWIRTPDFPNTIPFWYGLDFGFTNDPTAIVKNGYSNDVIFAEEKCYKTGMTNEDIANHFKMIGYNGEPVICDSAEPKSIEELRRLGIDAIGVVKGKDSINNGIDYLKRKQIVIVGVSPNLTMENKRYQWTDKGDGTFVNVPLDKNNHLMDALRYANTIRPQVNASQGQGYGECL